MISAVNLLFHECQNHPLWVPLVFSLTFLQDWVIFQDFVQPTGDDLTLSWLFRLLEQRDINLRTYLLTFQSEKGYYWMQGLSRDECSWVGCATTSKSGNGTQEQDCRWAVNCDTSHAQTKCTSCTARRGVVQQPNYVKSAGRQAISQLGPLILSAVPTFRRFV